MESPIDMYIILFVCVSTCVPLYALRNVNMCDAFDSLLFAWFQSDVKIVHAQTAASNTVA